MCRFRLFVALCDHNPPTLRTDRRTDGRRARNALQEVLSVPERVGLVIANDVMPCNAEIFNAHAQH